MFLSSSQIKILTKLSVNEPEYEKLPIFLEQFCPEVVIECIDICWKFIALSSLTCLRFRSIKVLIL